jgi:phenylpyruvate tautomerase PptA (4-oxalocrotonate tautomerase family)
MLQAITAAVHESIGAPVESIRVWIHEFPDTDFMAAGTLARDRHQPATP